MIGLLFGWCVVRALRDEGITSFNPAAGTLIFIMIFAGLSGVVAAIFPARRAAKLDMLRAISSE